MKAKKLKKKTKEADEANSRKEQEVCLRVLLTIQ